MRICIEMNTKGQVELRRWLAAAPERTQAFVATRVGVTQPSVSGWLRGASRPEHEHRLAIRLLTGIAPEAWLTAEESSQLEEVRERIAEPREGDDPDPDAPIPYRPTEKG